VFGSTEVLTFQPQILAQDIMELLKYDYDPCFDVKLFELHELVNRVVQCNAITAFHEASSVTAIARLVDLEKEWEEIERDDKEFFAMSLA
jgi:hypothetical protein